MRTDAILAAQALLCIVATLMLPSPTRAQAGGRYALPTAGGVQTFYLQSEGGKEKMRAEVLSVDGDQATLRVHAGGGTLERTLGLGEFTEHSAYRIVETATPDDDATKQLDLARFAASQGLITSARRALSRARSVSGDPSYGADVEATISTAAADALIEQFHEDLEAGRLSSAEKKLETALARHPDEIDARRGRALQDELDTARAEIERGERREEAAREAKEVSEQREKVLRPVRKRLERANDSYQKALANSKNGSTANRQMDSSIRDYRAVMKEVEKIGGKYENDEVLMAESSRINESAKSQLIDALLASGSLHLVRSQINSAMGRVNEALALDPGSKRAQAMRGRIEVAANQQRGWGW